MAGQAKRKITYAEAKKALAEKGIDLTLEDAPAAVAAVPDSPPAAAAGAGGDSATLTPQAGNPIAGIAEPGGGSVDGRHGAGTSTGGDANPRAGPGTMVGLDKGGKASPGLNTGSPAGTPEQVAMNPDDMPSDTDMPMKKKKSPDDVEEDQQTMFTSDNKVKGRAGTGGAARGSPGSGDFGLVTQALESSLSAADGKSVHSMSGEGAKETPQKTEVQALAESIVTEFRNSQQKQIEALATALGITPKKMEAASSMVDDDTLKANKEAIGKAVEYFQAVKDNPRGTTFMQHTWFVDKEQFLAEHLYSVPSGASMAYGAPQKVKDAVRAGGKEAVTIGAGDLGQVFSKQILLIPGGRMFVPVRQYFNFTGIPNGADRANWYKIGAFDFGAITEGTEPSNVSQTVTKVQATPAVRGAVQRVGYSQIESSPFNLVQAINNAMALAAINDEATDALDTVYNAVSPTNWVNGNTGAAITSDDLASIPLTAKGVLAGKSLLMNQGYDTSPGNVVFFVHPQNYQQLLNDTNLQRYFQWARPDITATAILEMLFGVDIVVTNKVHAQSGGTGNVYRNVMAIKGVAFGFASARDITLEAQRRNEVQQVILSGTHRIKSAVIEETATVRVSASQTGAGGS